MDTEIVKFNSELYEQGGVEVLSPYTAQDIPGREVPDWASWGQKVMAPDGAIVGYIWGYSSNGNTGKDVYSEYIPLK
jgi:hypothetical protein